MSENGSPFVKAKTRKKRLKMLLVGTHGVGKTIEALSFPNPAVIDLEAGTTHYGDDFGFEVMPASTPEEVMEAVKWLMTNKHNYSTLVIDPITIYWEALQAKFSDIFLIRNKGQKGDKFDYYDMQMRDWNIVKAEHKYLNRLITRLDMNVIFTAHHKDEVNKQMEKIGDTYGGMKGLEYFFDTVVRLWRSDDGRFMAKVDDKDRNNFLPVEAFERTPGFIVDAFGRGTLEAESVPIQFATPEQQERLLVYFGMDFPPMKLPMSPDRVKRFLSKECDGVNEIDEITTDHAEALLKKLDKAYEEKKNAKG